MEQHWNNFYERFAATAGRFASHIAVQLVHRESVETVTYGELQKKADAAARFLSSHKIQPEDRCAILADNDIAWCAAYLGILRVGAVAVPFATHYTPQQIAKLLQDSGAKIVFTTEHYAPVVEEACGLADTSVKLALLRDIEKESESLNAPGEVLRANVATVMDAAVILYTSGTTSDPKGVVLTHGNLLAEAAAVFAALKLDENDSILGVMPLYHSLAQLANLLLPFIVGARVIYLAEISASEMLRALREQRPTLFCCVPQFFYLIHQRVLRKVGEGGQGSVGEPLTGIEVKIMSAASDSADGDMSGEIAIRGPIVMKEYFHRPDTTAEVVKDGWFLTGDLGRLDDRGRLAITGRKKEVIILSSGKNIYPEEIEAQYAQSPFIKELCILGKSLTGEPAAE